MAVTCILAALAALTPLTRAAQADEIVLVNFKGEDPLVTHSWRALNDPVMGGRSYASVSIADGLLSFTGECKIVPSLKAPGFVTARSVDVKKWTDVSSCKGIQITAQAASKYAGYRLSFGTGHPIGAKFFAYGYKSHFWPSVGSMGSVRIPFGNFTDFWDDATGEPIHTCRENPEYCPDDKTKRDLKTMSIWGEGVEGTVDLKVESVSGYGCVPAATPNAEAELVRGSN